VLTQHPGLSRAVVAMVPVIDMLRTELQPNGAFNVAEHGTVADPELFQAMRAYSPYHNIKNGNPVLLRIEQGGHGLGSSLDQQVSELTDIFAFLFDRLDIDYRPSRPAPHKRLTAGGPPDGGENPPSGAGPCRSGGTTMMAAITRPWSAC
jgi:prolyl oligopeptidase